MARILQVCNSDFYLTHFLVPLVRGLLANGHEVECVCDGDDVDLNLFDRKVRVHQLEFPRTNSPREFLRSIEELRKLIRSGRYDCVNSHNRAASIVGRIAAWLERVPLNLYTAHGFYFHDDQRRLPREATIALEAVLARITDHTLSQSSEDAELMMRRRLIAKSEIEVIGNGIDTRRFDPRLRLERPVLEQRFGLKTDRFRIVSTGRIVRAKGFTDLLEAFALLHDRYPNSELLIVGGNLRIDIEPYQAEFMARAKILGVVDSVVVTGLVKRVEEYLAASDVFVLASYREGMPRAMLEAMSMELPVVVTDIRGCRQLIRTGVNGVLFPPHDHVRLASILLDLYSAEAKRRELGTAARQTVQSGFDERDYVARQVLAIDRLLQAATSSTRGEASASGYAPFSS